MSNDKQWWPVITTAEFQHNSKIRHFKMIILKQECFDKLLQRHLTNLALDMTSFKKKFLRIWFDSLKWRLTQTTCHFKHKKMFIIGRLPPQSNSKTWVATMKARVKTWYLTIGVIQTWARMISMTLFLIEVILHQASSSKLMKLALNLASYWNPLRPTKA